MGLNLVYADVKDSRLSAMEAVCVLCKHYVNGMHEWFAVDL